ncbi:MAG: hypothetical protein QM677_03075 [Microbacterium sp.]
MQIEEAQADVLRIYRGGFSGPLVSAPIWFAAAATYQWASPGVAMTVLFLGGMLIFPLSAFVLKILGGPALLPQGHPLGPLGFQSAATVPLGLLVAIVLGTLEPTLFFPAALIIVGAHYLTFITLYGTWLFGALAGALVTIGAVALFALPALREPSGWIGAAVLLASAIPLYLNYRASLTKEAHPQKRRRLA